MLLLNPKWLAFVSVACIKMWFFSRPHLIIYKALFTKHISVLFNLRTPKLLLNIQLNNNNRFGCDVIWLSKRLRKGPRTFVHVCTIHFRILCPPHNEVFGGILVSLRPSVCPSVCPSVRPSRIPCPLCSAYSAGWIHVIFIQLIEHLQKVCRV